MNKLNTVVVRVKSGAVVVYKVAKVAGIVVVIITSLVGGYVLTNTEVRNLVIDYAQNQAPVEAQSPKAN